MDAKGEPFFTPAGRDKILSAADIARIEIALREGLERRSNFNRHKRAKHRAMKAAECTSKSTWNAVAELLNDPSLRRS